MYSFPAEDNIVPCSDMAGEAVDVGDLVNDVAMGYTVILPLSLDLLYRHMKDVSSTLS